MTEDPSTASAEETQVTFNIKSSNESKYVLTLPVNTTVADVKGKLSGSEYADIPVERQRLIYSGRVLKDPDTLASIKIKDGNTVHLVKGAASNARQNPATQGVTSTIGQTGASSQTPSQVPTNLATGTANNPLAGLTGARYAGFHGLPGADMFGPDGGMGPPPDADQLLDMMDNPMFASQFNEAMNNPAVIQMMQNNPMIRNNPVMRQMLESPEMRRMLLDPQMIRSQLQMQRAMRGDSGGSAFPAPGVTNTTPSNQQGTPAGDSTGASPSQPNTTLPTQNTNPFAMLEAIQRTQGNSNPFAALLGAGGSSNLPGTQTANSTAATTSSTETSRADSTTAPGQAETNNDQLNPFASLFGSSPGEGGQQNPIQQMAMQMMQNPEMMRNMMQAMGGGAGSTGAAASNQDNPFAGLFNPFGLQPQNTQPPDNRPPEEVYSEQLRQLNDMGFYEFERNVQALRRSGGSVQGAIEHLLSGS